MSYFTPPNKPVEWLVIDRHMRERRVTAETAFEAAAQCGLQLSECIVQQVVPTLTSKP